VPEEIEEKVEMSNEAAGIAVSVIFVPKDLSSGEKRKHSDPLSLLPSKKPKTDDRGKGIHRTLKMEVWRQSQCLGELEIGQLRRH